MVDSGTRLRVKSSEREAARLLLKLDRKAGRESDPFVKRVAEADLLTPKEIRELDEA